MHVTHLCQLVNLTTDTGVVTHLCQLVNLTTDTGVLVHLSQLTIHFLSKDVPPPECRVSTDWLQWLIYAGGAWDARLQTQHC